MAPYVSVNSSSFCNQRRTIKDETRARSSARVLLTSPNANGRGAYDAIDAGEEGVTGLGGRERRHRERPPTVAETTSAVAAPLLPKL